MMWAGTGGERQLHLQRLGPELTPAAAKEPKAATVKCLPDATTCLTPGGCRFTPRSQAPLCGSVPPTPSCSSSMTSNQNKLSNLNKMKRQRTVILGNCFESVVRQFTLCSRILSDDIANHLAKQELEGVQRRP